MGNRWSVLGFCIVVSSASLFAMAESGSDVSVASLASRGGPGFQPQEIIFIQQYYSYAPKFFIEDVLKKEKALPAGAAASIVRGKELPRELVPFLRDSPESVTRNLAPLPYGLERKVLGTRFLLLNSRLIVQDLVHLPTTVRHEENK